MSNVRLSNGSPTLERTDAAAARGMAAADRDHRDHHPKPSACRSLFGSVDHDSLRRDLKVHLQGMEEAATAKWNFDFSNHAPLRASVGPRGFDWETVDRRDIPDFYSRTSTHRHQHRGEGRGSANGGGGSGGAKKQQQAVVAAAGNNNVDVNGNHHNNCVVLVGQQGTLVGQQGTLVGQQGTLVGQQGTLVGQQGTLVQGTLVGQQGTGGSATERADLGLMECSEQCSGGQRKRPAVCHESTALSAQTKRSHTSSDEVRCPNMTLSSELTPRKSSPKRQT